MCCLTCGELNSSARFLVLLQTQSCTHPSRKKMCTGLRLVKITNTINQQFSRRTTMPAQGGPPPWPLHPLRETPLFSGTRASNMPQAEEGVGLSAFAQNLREQNSRGMTGCAPPCEIYEAESSPCCPSRLASQQDTTAVSPFTTDRGSPRSRGKHPLEPSGKRVRCTSCIPWLWSGGQGETAQDSDVRGLDEKSRCAPPPSSHTSYA